MTFIGWKWSKNYLTPFFLIYLERRGWRLALFKIFKGESQNLPQNYNEGYAYFTIDDGKFYIDTNNSSNGRVALNANKADRD